MEFQFFRVLLLISGVGSIGKGRARKLDFCFSESNVDDVFDFPIGVLFCGWNHVRNLISSVSVISFRKRIGCFVLLFTLEWVYMPKEGGK